MNGEYRTDDGDESGNCEGGAEDLPWTPWRAGCQDRTQDYTTDWNDHRGYPDDVPRRANVVVFGMTGFATLRIQQRTSPSRAIR
jgi:hypothetical protein